MYVCIYVCMYVCVCVCIHVCMYVCMYVHRIHVRTVANTIMTIIIIICKHINLLYYVQRNKHHIDHSLMDLIAVTSVTHGQFSSCELHSKNNINLTNNYTLYITITQYIIQLYTMMMYSTYKT